ncbi:MAG TPA: FAD:protein FMN transferase [Gemmataceae bacterium]|jgi:thiamine biosynthesis lipoprotein|nr:FAD:protein FMN transferase [Gemmataceae bacterium]
MNRREFFSVSAPTATADPEIALLRFARTAMATVFEVLLPWGTPDAEGAAASAFDRIDGLEAQLTVYRDTSEVSRLNRLAAQAPVPVERGLFDLLMLAGRITAETGGAFDITAGPLIRAWGFFNRQGRVPDDAERAAAMETVGMKHVGLDARRRSVRFDRPGVEINLGSIGKGYSLDRAGDLLRRKHGITAGLINGGNSSVLAIGSPPNDPRGWTVGIRDPANPESRLAVVRLRNRALGTSASTYQHFGYNGRKLGHLLDSRTGRPAEGVALASALAPTAAEADALATAFYVLGPDAARRYCESHPDVAAIVLRDEPGAELEAINLPPGDLVPAPACIASADSPWELA